ncbi:MAG: helicase-related protein [Rheinheimera sp.]|nr:helicase-related protein [Rheinheimera sp.]
MPLLGKSDVSLSSNKPLPYRRCSQYRKIVLATNIAETSLTIDGITLVIDSGQARQATSMLLPSSALVDRILMQISQAAAIQRAGRAGQTECRVYAIG